MFEGLQDSVMKSLFGQKGGITHGDLANITRREKFSTYLPYDFYDKENGCYECSDDNIGYIWECTPLYFVNAETKKKLQNMLEMKLPNDVCFSFHLYADPHIKPVIDSYQANKKRDCKLARKTVEEYSKFLTQGSKGLSKINGTPVRNFRLFVSIKSMIRLHDDVISDIEEALDSGGLNPVKVNDQSIVELLRRFFNTENNCDINTSVQKNTPLSKQVIYHNTQISFPLNGYTKIGKNYASCLTDFTVPDTTNSIIENQLIGGFMGSRDDSSQITSPFLLSIIVTFSGASDEVKSKAKIIEGQSLVGDRAKELKKRLQEFAWIADLKEGEREARVLKTLWIFDENKEKLQSSVSKAKRIAEGFNYKYTEESLLTTTLMIASLPLGYYNHPGNTEAIDRYRILPTRSIAAILPVQADFTGSSRTIGGKVPASKSPVILTVGRKGQIQGFDVFDKDADNHNFIVSAGSGAGKSMQLNKFISDYYNSGAIVRAIDIGNSLEKTCKMNKGRFLDIGSSGEHLIFNPYYSQAKDSHDKKEDLTACVTVLAEMVFSASGASLSETQWSLLKRAAEYVREKGDIDNGIDATQHYLYNLEKIEKDSPFIAIDGIQSLAKSMAFNIQDFSSTGMYGKYFNGPSNFNISNDEMVVLELQQLKDQKELFIVIVMQVVNTITQDLYLSDRGERRFIMFEEAAEYLKRSGVRDLTRLASIIEEGYRRARKHKGSFGVVIQSLLDLTSFGPVGQVAWSNADFKIQMKSGDYRKAREEKLIEHEGLSLDLLESIRNKKPRYSEMFWETPFGIGAGRLIFDSWNYWVATSTADEFKLFRDLTGKGLTPAEAVSRLSGVPL